ncbi:hypothetical protein HanRHA438_Chr07g0298981 [Helianthus annuus]|uniref:Uncharacterized protein n=1 Tax=Helianthus annuus TaxID=4232 RepID=A0A9K3IJS6_HELAN|nr:hypothetical protein HanXRQr2_Chr07g0288441 [Helianthus annuus]KAJ0730825.1 hypothetical protein HanOQP8_Chr07g0244771 [Helianthus annuus]KAJ0904200.1 hypothetical protein HanPSC8_Chr07g0279221 [Helianthus annuus]KAJ0907440.1 hypothetical protein HanRHA438_Chr07g0298981 [Helianthus annuus]
MFVAIASQVDDVAAVETADCFFGVQGLGSTSGSSTPISSSPELSPSSFGAVGPSQLSLTAPEIRHRSCCWHCSYSASRYHAGINGFPYSQKK